MDTESRAGAQLETLLDRLAHRIVDSGSRGESQTLCAIAAVAREVSPGAAAALVDWNGSEIARLRAFGIAHGIVLRDLEPRDRVRLLEQLLGSDHLAVVG